MLDSDMIRVSASTHESISASDEATVELCLLRKICNGQGRVIVEVVRLYESF